MNQAEQIVMQPMQWALTPDIEDVRPLSEMDADCLREVREVLVKHGALGRFAVSLIHKHFDIAANEQMVEFTDITNRSMTIRPVAESESLQTVQTTWRFAEEVHGPQPTTVCIYRCYFDRDSTPQHVGKHVY